METFCWPDWPAGWLAGCCGAMPEELDAKERAQNETGLCVFKAGEDHAALTRAPI